MKEEWEQEIPWQEIHKDAGIDILTIVMDLVGNRVNSNETMERIGKHCTLSYLAGRRADEKERELKKVQEELKELKDALGSDQQLSEILYDYHTRMDVAETKVVGLQKELEKERERADSAEEGRSIEAQGVGYWNRRAEKAEQRLSELREAVKKHHKCKKEVIKVDGLVPLAECPDWIDQELYKTLEGKEQKEEK